jgi:hypothetical protein
MRLGGIVGVVWIERGCDGGGRGCRTGERGEAGGEGGGLGPSDQERAEWPAAGSVDRRLS